jgi:citrate lyase beta subunit
MRTTLAGADTRDLVDVIEATLDAHRDRRRRGPWSAKRQPVHTVYMPADRIVEDSVSQWGAHARRLLDIHAATSDELAAVFDVDDTMAALVRERAAAKLATEPIEDLRIDFEDGYGTRDDHEEDRDAVRAASIVARPGSPAFVGLRVKSFADGGHQRAIRTLDGFVTALLDASGGTLPDGFVITFPKVVAAAHVEAFAELLDRLEHALGLPQRRLVFEIQIETTESVIDHAGRVTLPSLVRAAGGRLVGAHFGVFDYTAACGLPAAQQRLDHPACDFARHIMQVTLGGTGIRLSDGSTNRVPADDSAAAVHAVWRHHAALVRHSLAHGFPQGWDMHPAHLVSRFVVLHAFHLAHLDDTTARLAAWAHGDGAGGHADSEPGTGDRGRAASGDAPGGVDHGGGVADEPATISALLRSLRRAIDCGAVDEQRALDAAGIDRDTLQRAP